MKAALALIGLLAPIALAATYQTPTVYQITGHSCSSHPVQSIVTGTNDDGTVDGLAWADTYCAGGIWYSGCASVRWMSDGQMISYKVESQQWDGRNKPLSNACFGS
jgi:hypothetical protein